MEGALEILDQPISAAAADARLDAIARRHARAGGPVIRLLEFAGARGGGLADGLPPGLRDGLAGLAERALRVAMRAADRSRRAVGDPPGWATAATGAAMGAAGGFGGLPGALAELPATTTLFLHAIQGVAAEHGFDPAEPGVRFDCVQVFACRGPLERGDSADFAFLAARAAVTGPAMQALAARAAPRLAAVFGHKLAAQSAPALGALAGAAVNCAYARHYRETAHVRFGLRRLAIDADRDMDELADALRRRLARG